jgi:hypothetical protein
MRPRLSQMILRFGGAAAFSSTRTTSRPPGWRCSWPSWGACSPTAASPASTPSARPSLTERGDRSMTAGAGAGGIPQQDRQARPGRVGPPPVVTIAARYGAGGHMVGPEVAERLGVMFLDQVIASPWRTTAACRWRLRVPQRGIAARRRDHRPRRQLRLAGHAGRAVRAPGRSTRRASATGDTAVTAERLSISWTSTTRPDSATCAFTTAANPRSPPTTTWLSTAQQ